MKFREHRGTFGDSMETTQEIPVSSLEELEEYFEIKDNDILSFKKYEDNRNDWDNHWILINGAVRGITDGKF